jgi:hypothetical protein
VKWQTDRIAEKLEKAGCTVKSTGQGGDVDSDNLRVSCGNGEYIYARGFVVKGSITSPADCEVDMVEVSDGQDSSGGLNSTRKKTFDTYSTVVRVLDRMGFKLVKSLDDYF